MSVGPRAALVVALAATTTLLAGFAIKNECTYAPWDDHYQYRNYCYSDILPLYHIRQLEHDAVPYEDQPSEYPVLSGYFTYGVALVTDTLHAYLVLTYGTLLFCGLLTTYLLWRLELPLEHQLAWAAGPALVIHSYTNWDLFAVVLAVGGWFAWRRDRPLAAALLFGLGGAAKLWPAFFLPFLFFDAARTRDWKRTGRVLAGGVLGFGVPNGYAAARAWDNWWGIWTFHAKRDPDFETPWQAFVKERGQDWWPNYDWGTQFRHDVGLFGAAILVLGVAALAWRQWKTGLDPLAAGALLVLAFLLTNRVYSPQYTLWTLPLLVLLRAPLVPVVGFLWADLGVFLVRYKLFVPKPPATEGWNLDWLDWNNRLVNLRWLLMLWATVAIVVRMRRRKDDSPPGPPCSRHPLSG